MSSNSKTKKLISVIAFFCVCIVIISGCKSRSSSNSSKAVSAKDIKKNLMKSKPSNMSEVEYRKILSKIDLQTISADPNSDGFMVFYGQVTNNSNRTIKRAEIVIKTVEGKDLNVKETTVLGNDEVSDVEPGDTKTFNIVTSLEVQDVKGYHVQIGSVEL